MNSDKTPMTMEKRVAILLERQERLMVEIDEVKKGVGAIRGILIKALPVLSAFQKGEALERQWVDDRQDRMDKALRYLKKRSARLAKAKSPHQ